MRIYDMTNLMMFYLVSQIFLLYIYLVRVYII